MVNQATALGRWELIRTLTAYSGITTADGAADGSTLVDANLINNALIAPAAIPEKAVLVLTGNARGQDKGAASFNNITGTITLQGTGFSAQILAGTIYRILNISSVEIDVKTIDTKIGTNVDPAGTTTLFAWMANLLLSIGLLGRPGISLYEGWQDELGIDFTLWTVLNPATPWARGAGAGVAAGSLVATAPLLINEVARLVGNQRWPIMPNLSGTNTILREVEFEWEMTLSDITQLVIGTCFFGFTPNQADTRASNNIVGFGLVGAAPAQELQTITDLAGVETVNAGFGLNLANLNKFKIRVVQVAGVATIEFSFNEIVIATHITDLPDLPMYPNWYLDTTALGPCTPQIGIVRIGTEDVILP